MFAQFDKMLILIIIQLITFLSTLSAQNITLGEKKILGSKDSSDDFLLLNQKQCLKSQKLSACVKFKVAKVLFNFATNRYNYFQKEDSRSAVEDVLKPGLIQLTDPSELQLFENVRSANDDMELTKAWKFFKRTLQTFLQGHGVEVPFSSDTGTKLREFYPITDTLEPRGTKKKKKWTIIFPLIMLVKLIHLKFTVILLLLGIGGLQFLVLFGVIYVIHHLKANTFCKLSPFITQTHSHQFSSEPDYSGYGGNYHPHANPHEFGAGYGKDWGNSKAYGAYNYHEGQPQK